MAAFSLPRHLQKAQPAADILKARCVLQRARHDDAVGYLDFPAIQIDEQVCQEGLRVRCGDVRVPDVQGAALFRMRAASASAFC